MTVSTLRKVLALDAFSCATFFILCVPLSGLAVRLTGLPATVIEAGGWICLAAALLLAGLALSNRPPRSLVVFAAIGNAFWIAASLAVVAIFGAQMSAMGVVLVVGQAAAVGVLTWLELAGARPSPATA